MNPSKNRKISVVLASVALGLSACSAQLDESGFTDENPVDLVFAEESEAGEVPAEAFDFTAAELYTGEPISGTEILSNSPTLINFVDPNCPICVTEGPELAEAANDFADVNVVVVHGFAQSAAYVSYVERSELNAESILHVVDNEGALSRRFGLTVTPATVMVDENGKVTVARGGLTADEFRVAAENLVGA